MDRIFRAKLTAATSSEDANTDNVADMDNATEILWHRESDVLRWIAAARGLDRNSNTTAAAANADSTSPQFSIGK